MSITPSVTTSGSAIVESILENVTSPTSPSAGFQMSKPNSPKRTRKYKNNNIISNQTRTPSYVTGSSAIKRFLKVLKLLLGGL